MSRLDDPIAMELPDKFNRQTRSRMAKRKAEKPRAFRMHADGIGYDVYHPTKGWRRYSARRIAADGLALAKRVGQLPWWSRIPAFEKAFANG